MSESGIAVQDVFGLVNVLALAGESARYRQCALVLLESSPGLS